MLIEVSKLSNLSASIASRVYPNNSLSGQLVQSGGTRDRGVNIVSVPTKSGRLATMLLRSIRLIATYVCNSVSGLMNKKYYSLLLHYCL